MNHRVVVLALPGVVTFDLTCAVQVLGYVSPSPSARPLYDFVVCSAGGRRVETGDGMTLGLAHSLGAMASADTVVVPGYRGAAEGPPPDRVLQALDAAGARGVRVMSFCMGAFALGHAGLLDGRRATTHWDAVGQLADQFPRTSVDPNPLYVDEGAVLTSAGMAAGLDLALHVVRCDHGADIAADVARWNVIAPHRDGGQAQFIARPVVAVAQAGLGATRAWALDHLSEPLSLADLAAHACCSERTLTRRFHAETGLSPKKWLLTLRLQTARQLLERTASPIEDVADQAGFSSANAMRSHFTDVLHTTPTAYRRRFRAM